MNTKAFKSRYAHLNHSALLSGIRHARKEEKRILTDLLYYLLEIDRRKAYLDWGHSSLFIFLTKELGYEKASAYRRQLALEIFRIAPETVEEKLQAGTVTLSGLCQVQQVVEVEAKNRVVTREEKSEILALVENKSQTQADRVLAETYPEATLAIHARAAARPKQYALPHKQVEIRWVIPEELAQKLERLKDLRAHASFDRDPVKLLEWLVETGLNRIDPERREARREKLVKNRKNKSEKREDPEFKPKTRESEVIHSRGSAAKPIRVPIRTPLRDQTFRAAAMKCSYISPQTGRICESTHALEIDHIRPVARGGTNSRENLRVLCDQHNRGRSRC